MVERLLGIILPVFLVVALGFVAAHLEGLAVDECLQRAVVTASFAIETWGSDALITATREEADRRLRSWYGEGEKP